jgi:hypothetical protein
VTEERPTQAPSLVLEGTEIPVSFLLQPQAIIDVGRGSEMTFRISYDFLGRRQSRFSARDGSWWVEDLESPAGTWVDEEMVRGQARITVGSRLRLGGLRLLVTASGRCLIHTRAPWPLGRVLSMAEGLAADLARQHAAGRLHHDILPGWILIEEPGGRARLAGFLDRSVDEILHSRDARYIAPELYQREPDPATPAADVFSVGCILREWLTARYPFDRESHMAMIGATVRGMAEPLPRDVPEPVARMLDAMVRPDPRDRPGDGAALQAELRPLLDRFADDGRS